MATAGHQSHAQSARRIAVPDLRCRFSDCLRVIILSILLCVSFGCKSPSQYSSPRVVGRVLDVKTRQPIRDVRVFRPGEEPNSLPQDPPKGGQLLMQQPFARSAADGSFALVSVRTLAFFKRISWDSVTVSFEHPDYEFFETNISSSGVTNSPGAEPVVNAGDIFLVHMPK